MRVLWLRVSMAGIKKQKMRKMIDMAYILWTMRVGVSSGVQCAGH